MLRHINSLFTLLLLGIILVITSTIVVYAYLVPSLPDAHSLKQTQLQIPLKVFSQEGELIAEFGDKRRTPVDYKEIPPQLIEAVLAAEDDRFFDHPGVDYQGLIRAGYSLLTTGKKSQGGSTITMQLARNFFLSTEKTFLRKLNEIILAIKIEQVLTKEEILTLYLNKIYLGKRAYGIAAAAEVYYGKSLEELSLAETAMIAGLPKAPSRYNPITNPDRAILRRNYVLRRMSELNYISEENYQQAVAAITTAQYHQRKVDVKAPYAAEMVREKLVRRYGESVYSSGYQVYTTIQSHHQHAANDALQKALLDYDKRHGYRGAIAQVSASKVNEPEQVLSTFSPIGPLHPGLVVSITRTSATVHLKAQATTQLSLNKMRWAKPYRSVNSLGPVPKQVSDIVSVGDIAYFYQDNEGEWQLTQLPEAQGALVSLNPEDGAITAINGGFDYYRSKYNRATQSKRQPGSGFKPFLYSAAIESGYTAATIINDAPVVLDDPNIADTWRPSNYSGKFYGPTRLRSALTHSRNLVSIRLLRDISVPYTRSYAELFGFTEQQMPNNLSLALGSGSASPLEMATAYAVFANGGYRVSPYLIKRIVTHQGDIVMEASPATVCPYCTDIGNSSDSTQTTIAADRVISPQQAYLMNSLLRDVIQLGTGRKALQLGRYDLAGKTGTTNDQVDAWFNGFHPSLVAVSWVGFDTPSTLGRYETGGKAALPMWIDFMAQALSDVTSSPLELPDNMATVKIHPQTGLLAQADDPEAIFEDFRLEYIPTHYHQSLPDEALSDGEKPDPDILFDLF